MNDVFDLERFLANPHDEGARVCDIPDTDWDSVHTALHHHASLHFYALSRYRAARSTEQAEEYLYKQEVRKAYARLREEGAGVSDAKDAAELEEPVVEAYRSYLDAEKETGRWRSLAEGLESRGSMLQQISARQREDLKKNWNTYNDPKEQDDGSP